MGSLFGTLNNSLQAIQAFQAALSVSQNNVSNSSTPGYARQVANLESLPFDPGNGSSGGVKAGPTHSTQNEYAESGGSQPAFATGKLQRAIERPVVRSRASSTCPDKPGSWALSTIFSKASPPGARLRDRRRLSNMFSPSAQSLAQSFQSTAASLSQTTTQLNQQIGSTVQQINQIASQIQADNIAIQKNPDPDGGSDAGRGRQPARLARVAFAAREHYRQLRV